MPRDTVLLPVAKRLQSAALDVGIELELITGPVNHPRLAIRALPGGSAPDRPAAYALSVTSRGIFLDYHDEEGLRSGVATLRQLFREYGRHLPCLAIRDYPDFAKRGVMLDISRGRVPNLATLLELTSHLADFKINEFQLYTEHTFAYRNYEPVWRDWGALTGDEILQLDAHCRKLGIELVPNQNSFGHLRYWLEYPPLKKLAETAEPWPDQNGAFLRYPATLAPNNPGTLPFLRGLYDELLPCFTSGRFNVGCDETGDRGRGQSKALCEKLGKGRVYVDFLKQIYREVTARKKQMMFWGDIILHYPELVKELPKDVVALNWGYEANHPFDRESAIFARSKIPFYVSPGTSTWMTLIGRHDNAFANLRHAALSGRKHGALGYLITDWGDGGHLQPLAVSYLPYLFGASVSWCAAKLRRKTPRARHQPRYFPGPDRLRRRRLRTRFRAPQIQIISPPTSPPSARPSPRRRPKRRELFCRDGLKYYASIPGKNIRAALEEVEAQRELLHRARPARAAAILVEELDFAARMAAQSCKFMLWQQALAAGRKLRRQSAGQTRHSRITPS